MSIKILIKLFLPIADIFLLVFVYPAAFLLKKIRSAGIRRMPLCRKALLQVGMFPIVDHYYEPLFDSRHLKRPLSENRVLPGIDWNVDEQLKLLDSFRFTTELTNIPHSKVDELEFYLNNGQFESGDAEYWYSLIRQIKPGKIFEIGSGNSTLMAIRAIKKNEEETPGYKCKHLCVEPYQVPWLEKSGVSALRKKIEDVDKELLLDLGENDILFIDSSHIIRPQGDVLFEYLELLPSLQKGVIVHVHDIFSPKDYPEVWVSEDVRFWNEQYLLEGFLTSNCDWKIIGALNFLRHNYYEKLKDKCPYLTTKREPGSFYMQKIS